MKKIGVGVIGTGGISHRHVPALLANRNVKLVAGCDVDRGRLRAWCDRYGVEKQYTDVNEMLKDDEIEVVEVLTRVTPRARLTIASAEAGKHCLIEKPMCLTLREADEVIASAKKNHVKVMVGAAYLFLSCNVKARALIDEGRIGRPKQIRIIDGRTPVGGFLESKTVTSPPEPPRAPMRGSKPAKPAYWEDFDMGHHYWSMARYFMQWADIVEIASISVPNFRSWAGVNPTSAPLAVWRYRENQLGTLNHLDDNTFNYHGIRVDIFGTEGMIETMGDGGGPTVTGIKLAPLILYTRGRTEYFRFEEETDPHREVGYWNFAFKNEIDHLINCVLQDTEPCYTIEDARKDHACLLAWIRSAQTERPASPNDVPLDYVPEGAGVPPR